MRIQHNIAALNSFRNLTNNNSAVSKNLEKLSSGYRINRAGDDAAGLAISEKMRAQITGLETAQKNASDGISLVQTAEGALTEVHSMLNRMVELADQSANGTYQNEVDRENLEAELNSLKDEIDRISKATNFNGINLLDGNLDSGKLPSIKGLDGITPTEVAATGNSAEFTVSGAANIDTGDELSLTVKYTDANGKSQEKTITLTAESKTSLIDKNGNKYTITQDATTAKELGEAFAAAAAKDEDLSNLFNISDDGAGKLTFTAKETGSASKVNVDSVKTSFSASNKATETSLSVDNTAGEDKKISYDLSTLDIGDVFEIDGKKFAFATADQVAAGDFDSDVNLVVTTNGNPNATDVGNMADVIANTLGVSSDMVSDAGTTITFSATPDRGGLSLQIGDTADDFNQLTVSVGAMDTASLGIKDISIADQTSAKAAVETLKDAINKVSSTRGDLGAIQNRLEHTINNLSVTSENMTAAESRIRDVDMAKEMMSYTKNNILVQSSQAMLAQANQVPQGVLQLLQ